MTEENSIWTDFVAAVNAVGVTVRTTQEFRDRKKRSVINLIDSRPKLSYLARSSSFLRPYLEKIAFVFVSHPHHHNHTTSPPFILCHFILVLI